MSENLAEILNEAEGASDEAIGKAEQTRREFAEINLAEKVTNQEEENTV